jgi:xanthine dehydrogenase FAD-binding subunit
LSLWQKLGLRGAQAISVISLAMRVEQGPGGVAQARFAYGSVGPTVLRASRCEEALMAAGQLDRVKIGAVARLACDEVRPISDIRASAQYRREMAAALLERGLLRLLPTVEGRDAR